MKALFGPFVYLGLTNSGRSPWVTSRIWAYWGRATMNWLVLPGYGESPVSGSPASPAVWPEAFSRGSSWLYSTFMV